MIDNVIAKKAHDLIQAGDDGAAWPIVDEQLNKNPDDPKALYLAGWIMRQQGHIGVALQLLRRAASIEQKVPNIWMHLGACYHDTHQYEVARECFHVVAKALPDDPMPLANIAASYVQQGIAREAVELLTQAEEKLREAARETRVEVGVGP
jgi:Flp pilus assembly protein TadD